MEQECLAAQDRTRTAPEGWDWARESWGWARLPADRKMRLLSILARMTQSKPEVQSGNR
jgi:hypothetical protein